MVFLGNMCMDTLHKGDDDDDDDNNSALRFGSWITKAFRYTQNQ